MDYVQPDPYRLERITKMANLVEYVKTVWENGKTALNAARMNNMEKGISDCATQINKLGDSVSRHRTALNNDRIRFEWSVKGGDNGLHVYVDNTLVAFIRQNTGL